MPLVSMTFRQRDILPDKQSIVEIPFWRFRQCWKAAERQANEKKGTKTAIFVEKVELKKRKMCIDQWGTVDEEKYVGVQ